MRHDNREPEINLCAYCGDTGIVLDEDGDRCICTCEAGRDAFYAVIFDRENAMEDQLQMMEFEDRISGMEDF